VPERCVYDLRRGLDNVVGPRKQGSPAISPPRATIRFVISTTRRAVTVMFTGLLSVTALLAQAKTTAPKSKVSSSEGFVVNPVVSKDFGCAEDLVKAMKASGIEQRKMLGDLIDYGCVRRFKGVFYGAKLESRKFAGVALAKVSLIIDVQMMEDVGFPHESLTPYVDDANANAYGWIVDSDFFIKTPEQFLKDFRESRQPR